MPTFNAGWAETSIASFEYKVTFEPNPNRRHTRGKRGKQHAGVTDLQAEFDEVREGSDWHRTRLAATDREHEKREKAAARHFSLLGFKGHDFKHLRGDERLEAMQSVANRNRVRTGTGGLSKQFKAFVLDEGLGHVPKRPVHPWSGVKKSKSAPASKASPLIFSLNAAVSRYKRTGALPDVAIDVVKAQPTDGIDGRALKRMIRAMLVRSGVEENPGPVCEHSTHFVMPRKQKMKGHKTFFYTCPKCDCKLDTGRVRADGSMYHPACEVELAAYQDAPVVVELQADLLGSCEAETRDLAALAPVVVPLGPPAVHSSPAPEVLPVPAPAPVGPRALSQSAPAAAAVPEQPARPPSPPPPSPEAAPASPEGEVRVQFGPASPFDPPAVNVIHDDHTLLGFRLTEKQLKKVVTQVVGPHTQVSRFDQVVKELEYVGERRLATARNVVELKKKMKVCQIRAVVRTYRIWPSIFAMVAATATSAGLMFYSQLLAGLCFSSVTSGVLAYACYVLAFRRSRAVYVAYIPHLVSAVLTEYDRGTNATAARATIRQKIRHLACMPIPDHSAAELIHGSEAVVMSLLESEDFFSTEAACFGRQ